MSFFSVFNRFWSIDIPQWPIFYIPIQRDPAPAVQVPEISSTTEVQEGLALVAQGRTQAVQVPDISSTTEIQLDEEDEDEGAVKGHIKLEDANEDEKDLKNEDEKELKDVDEKDLEDEDENDSDDEDENYSDDEDEYDSEDDENGELSWFYEKM